MLSKVFSSAIVGLDARIIEIEVNVSFGLKHFDIVGLPDKAVDLMDEAMSSLRLEMAEEISRGRKICPTKSSFAGESGG